MFTCQPTWCRHFELADIPLDSQRILFDGKQLEDERTMADYALDEAAACLAAEGLGKLPSIHLVLRLRGGMYHPTSGRGDNENLSGQPLTHQEVGCVLCAVVVVVGCYCWQCSDVAPCKEQRLQQPWCQCWCYCCCICYVSSDHNDSANLAEQSLTHTEVG
jgi:hypothetical protein